MSSESSGEDEDLDDHHYVGQEEQSYEYQTNDSQAKQAQAKYYPYQCNVCFKVFVSMKGLVQHSIIHTDRKPFACETCGKAFRFKSNLFEHRSIHSGDQPFVCQYCGKTCRLKGNLKKHLKTHVKEPQEIEQAYESVIAAHAVAVASNANNGSITNAMEYSDNDYESSPTDAKKPKRKATSKRKTNKFSTPPVLDKILKDENDTLAEGTHSFPPLTELCNSECAMDYFIQAARAIPLETYNCEACQFTFPCRYDMEVHCENTHDIRSHLDNPTNGNLRKPPHWCEICLRDFRDQKSYDQHFFFHRRVRALINKGELHINEPKILTFY